MPSDLDTTLAQSTRGPAEAAPPAAEGSLLSELLMEARLDDGAANKHGISSFLTELLRSKDTNQRVAKDRIDALILDIDRRLTAQVNAILHAPEVRALETAWRGVKYLVDEIEFRENVRLEFVNAKKHEFLTNFREVPELTHSALYATVYKEAIGQFGGRPYGVICSTYDFGPGAEDVELLRNFAAVGAIAHVPFLGNANPGMFGRDSFQEIPQLKDLQQTFENPRYQKWNAFRDSEDSRYVAMCMPRFLLRAPYGTRESELSVRDFGFSETVIDEHENYLWGPASLALTAKIADSFAKYRWCPNIIGPLGGGSVYNLPLHQYQQGGELKTKNPCEAAIEDRKEFEFAEQGFCALIPRKDSNNAAFFSANSVQRPKVFQRTAEGLAAQPTTCSAPACPTCS
jgi:type VI secretion system protein ImpC